MDEAERGADNHAVLRRLEHVERFFVGEITMIDAIDMIANGPLHRGGRARMTGDALVPLMRDLDGGRHLGLAHGSDFGARVGDELIARNVDLDVVDPLAAAKPNRAPDLVGPVGDHAEAFGMHMLLAFIAEAAGHRDFRPCGAIAWPSEITVFDLLAHDHVEAQLGGRC